ncbi:MAG: dipeptidase PepV [Clostridiales Family XIII bacterium]|jgi:succinyl-diaminopimelate desuccinylase|nr:dipeptidase PepV [Clostridiales Family XIII bacterium]
MNDGADALRLDGIIDSMKDEMVAALRGLIAIRSVAGPPEDGAPFGAGVRDAYAYMLKMAERDGFDTLDVDGYGGHIEFGGLPADGDGGAAGLSEKVLGILCHLDVVPEGGGWSVEPYAGTLDGGNIYGRGATDDKGPAIACYFAMKALMELGFMPRARVRLILGLDEETDWKGMERYLSKAKAPDFGFTPDAEFPAIHGEKGILIFELAKKMEKAKTGGLALRRLSGGTAANMVPDRARAVLMGDARAYGEVKDRAAEYRGRTGRQVNARGIGKSLEVSAQGVAAHGATPEKGLNAISILMDFLSGAGIAGESALEFIDFYNRHIGFETDGASMGCGLSDEASGSLAFNAGTIAGDEGAVILTVNIRYPVTMDADDVYGAMLPTIHRHDLGLVKLSHRPPIFMPEDDPLIESLMRVYRRRTGDLESRPLVIGGGTYARAAKNLVAFGAGFPGEPDLAHSRDERISVEKLVRIAKIYADAIRELSA